MGFLALAFLSVLSSQTRQALLILLPAPVVLGLLVRRFAASSGPTIAFGVVVALTFVAGAAVLQSGKFAYLEQVQHTGLSHDPSYSYRVNAIRRVGRMALDIAPLGTGNTLDNNLKSSYMTSGYSEFNDLVIDNEFVSVYVAFGVWGIPLLLGFYLICFRTFSGIKRIRCLEAAIVCSSGLTLLSVNLLSSPGANRVFKYETSGYSFIVLALASAWIADRVNASRTWSGHENTCPC
jgi:hypothetical protein